MEDTSHALHRPATDLEPHCVAPNESDTITHGTQMLALAGRQIVEYGDLRASVHKALDDVGADESGAARNEVSHACPLRHEPGHRSRCISCRWRGIARATGASALQRCNHTVSTQRCPSSFRRE